MAMERIAFEDATPKQLVQFGITLGLQDLFFQMGHPKLISMIKATGYELDYIEIDTAPPQADGPRIEPATSRQGDFQMTLAERMDPYQRNKEGKEIVVDGVPLRKRRMATVMIPRQEGVVGGRDRVFTCVNGKSMLTPRGQKCRIPFEHLEALDHAMQAIHNLDENGSFVGEPDMVHIYPFSVFDIDPDWEEMHVEYEKRKALPQAA